MSKWRTDIENAPKDGNLVLLFWHPRPGEVGFAEACYWDDERNEWVIWCECPGLARWQPGYTHWHPMPDPPTHNAQQEDRR